MDSKIEKAKKLLKKLSNRYGKDEIEAEEKIKRSIKDVKKKSGSMYNKDILAYTNDIALNYNSKEYPTITINDKLLDLTKKDNFFIKIMRKIYYWFANLRPEKLDKKGTIALSKDGVQIIPLQCQRGHAGVVIVDNKNKKIIIYEPNGNCLKNIDAFNKITTNKELFSKIFKPKDVDYLINNGFEVFDAYKYGQVDKHSAEKQIFGDNIITSNIAMNTDFHSKNGSCGLYCIKFISAYLNHVENAKDKKLKNYKKMLTNITKELSKLSSENLMDIKLSSSIIHAKNVLNKVPRYNTNSLSALQQNFR